jgi:VanZ family protein
VNGALLRPLHLAAFLGPLGVFTYLLLVPHPPKPKIEADWLSFLMDKSAHAGGFAYLAAVGSLYPRRPTYRQAVVAFLLLYGIGTEIAQTYTGRHGCVQDVLIDWAGIAAGGLFARRLLRRRAGENPGPPAFAGSHSEPGWSE